MSWVEDARKLMQDFVAPELRGINQRLDDVIAGMQKSFAEVERLANERDQASQRLANERRETSEKFANDLQKVMLDHMESLRRELLLAVDLAVAHRKIEELEGRRSETSPALVLCRRSI